MSNALQAALRYREMGISVIPCRPDKKPFIQWTEFQKRLPTPEEIKAWWQKWPSAMVAIVTGELSGLCAVDCDTPAGYEAVQKLLPDSFLTPIARTPRGGWHLYFIFPKGCKLTIGAGVMPGVDFRGEGGYVIAPPSVNGTGGAYSWADGLSLGEVRPGAMVSALLRALTYKNKNDSSIYRERSHSCSHPGFFFTEGRRDSDMYHLAHCLLKGGCEIPFAEYVLEIQANNAKPPFPKNEIKAKIESVLKREERREISFSEEVRDFIVTSNGYFLTSDVFNRLQVTSRQEKKNVVVALLRLQKEGLIERHGQRDGCYRRVETELNFIEFDDSSEEPYPLILPLKLHDMVEISAGNIILVGGEFNAGKTTFMLETLQMNKNGIPIRFISSEVSSQSEFKKRFRGFRGLPLSFWLPDEMTDYVARSNDFARALKAGALNLIDYLEFPESDFTMGAEMLRQIHDRLDGGVAVVACQKKRGQKLPRSGDLIMEKPRLAITLSGIEGTPYGVAEIVKAKIQKGGRHDGKRLRFEIVEHGSTFKIHDDWGFHRF